MAPKYSQPVAPVATAWPNMPAPQTGAGKHVRKPVAEIPWREFYLDPQLRKVIALALDNNRDLRVAVLNMKRYQALYQIRRSDLMPKVDASASATIQRIPEDLSSTGRAMTTDQYNVGLGLVSYELDMFGRVQSLKDQALEQYLGTEQAARSVQISLVSQISGAWLTLAADRERLKLAKATLASQQESYQLIQRRYDAGISSSLDLQQGVITVETARVDIARYTALVAQDENVLNFLVGTQVPPELLPQELSETVTALKDISPGTPSDVLLQRPDILQAEAQLKGANANIGAARAAFFPRITLVSSVGLGSDELAGLFKAGSLAWSFAPRISLPIFDGGSNRANLKVAEV
ncbi:MAG: efflux transporter outer membrane subunit, partial [Pelobacteraceae bacterium]